MGILDRIAGLFVPNVPSVLPAARALEPTSVLTSNDEVEAAVLRALQIAPSRTGTQLIGAIRNGQAPRRGTAELMLAYSRLPHLRSVVGRINQAVSQVGWRAFRVPSRSVRMALTRGNKDARRAVMKQAGVPESAVELEQHPFLSLMERFNSEMSGVAGRKIIQTHSDLKGDSFSIIERRGGETGDPIELWPIPPQFVTLPSRLDGPFEVRYRGQTVLVPRERMLYIRELDPHDPLSRGSGIGESLADELDADEFAGKHLKSWFLNRGIPSMLIGIEDAETDEVRVAREDWEERNRGPLRNNRVHFHNGSLTAVRLDDKFSDMEIVDLRSFTMRVVRETFNVPPELVGHLDNSNRATIEEALAIMAILVVRPRLELMRTEMQAQLVPLFDDGDTLVIDYDDPVPPDGARMLEAAKGAPWALNMNEWREMQGHGPVENGDNLHLINNALVDITQGGAKDVITFNELTLGIERLGAIGDVDGLNALRVALASRLGVTLDPIEGAETDSAPPRAPADDESEDDDDGGATAPRARAPLRLVRRKAVQSGDVDELVSAIDPRVLVREMGPEEERTVNFFGEDMTDDISKAWRPDAEAVVNFLAQFSSERVKRINDVTRERIRGVLVSGVAESQSVATIGRRLREEFSGMTKGRARRIARTEVYTAANFAREQAMLNEDVPFKRWVTQRDGRVRSAHRAMDGQTVPVGKTFVAPSGARARYPGGFRSAALNVNCRCVVTPARTAEQRGFDDEVVWRQFDREAARHEQRMERAFVRALREQEAALLRRLERFT